MSQADLIIGGEQHLWERALEATLIAGLAGIIGLILGRYWDSYAESRRWKRDQRIRTYEQIGGTYYTLREAIRTLALLPSGADESDDVASHALDRGREFNSAIFAVWIHGSESVANAAKDLSREVNLLYMAARGRQFAWEEWRAIRTPAEEALERFIEAVRNELSLPQLAVAIRIMGPDVKTGANAE